MARGAGDQRPPARPRRASPTPRPRALHGPCRSRAAAPGTPGPPPFLVSPCEACTRPLAASGRAGSPGPSRIAAGHPADARLLRGRDSRSPCAPTVWAGHRSSSTSRMEGALHLEPGRAPGDQGGMERAEGAGLSWLGSACGRVVPGDGCGGEAPQISDSSGARAGLIGSLCRTAPEEIRSLTSLPIDSEPRFCCSHGCAHSPPTTVLLFAASILFGTVG